jgi:catechol 2,3-dioxygenase-like lactoylglutathione lyase family enzyme
VITKPRPRAVYELAVEQITRYIWNMTSTSPKPSEVSQGTMTEADYYRTNAGRRGFLGHVSFGVRSYDMSKIFYTAVLQPFGVSIVYENLERKVLGYGFKINQEILNIFERGTAAHPPGPGTHLAFNAPSRKAVREFWEAGVINGGRSDGKPGLRVAYGENYYAAFLFDPDGFKLEAVFQEPE